MDDPNLAHAKRLIATAARNTYQTTVMVPVEVLQALVILAEKPPQVVYQQQPTDGWYGDWKSSDIQ